jgi:hypothetical protein
LTTQLNEGRGIMGENELLKALLAKMVSEQQAIRKLLSTEAFDIDEWKFEPNATVIQPLQTYDGPVVITSILAVFPVVSTSVLINLGTPGRFIQIPPTLGLFAVNDLRIQLGKDDVPRNMTIAPAGAAYINFFGYADKKVVEHVV